MLRCVRFSWSVFRPAPPSGGAAPRALSLSSFRIVSRQVFLLAAGGSALGVLRLAERKGGLAEAPAQTASAPRSCARMTGAHPLALKDQRSVFTSFPDGPRSSSPSAVVFDDSHRPGHGVQRMNERGEIVAAWPDEPIPDGWSVSRRLTAMDGRGARQCGRCAGGAAMNLEDVFEALPRGIQSRSASGRDGHRERLRRLRARGGVAVVRDDDPRAFEHRRPCREERNIPWDRAWRSGCFGPGGEERRRTISGASATPP